MDVFPAIKQEPKVKVSKKKNSPYWINHYFIIILDQQNSPTLIDDNSGSITFGSASIHLRNFEKPANKKQQIVYKRN